MAQWLKLSTAVDVRIGPFVDATDGVTPETTLDLSTADQAELLKATGATVSLAAATCTAITGVDGWYDLSLSTSHTDTAGPLTVIVQDASLCLPVFATFTVLPAAVYNALISATGNGLRAELIAISGSTTAADNLEAGSLATVVGTIDTSANPVTATSFESDDVTSAVADLYNGRLLIITSGTYAGQTTRITDYAKVGANGSFTFESIGSNTPANNDTFIIL